MQRSQVFADQKLLCQREQIASMLSVRLNPKKSAWVIAAALSEISLGNSNLLN